MTLSHSDEVPWLGLSGQIATPSERQLKPDRGREEAEVGDEVTAEPAPPAEGQLEVFASEVTRQREENARRQGNMHSRAGVLVAAAGIVTGLHLDHPTAWLLIPAALALATAGTGLAVLMTRTRHEPVATQNALDSLGGYSTFQVRYTLVKDNLTALQEGRDLLQHKAKLINVGYLLLAATWITQIAITMTTTTGS